ncbi:MAG TPA: hypothetical protein VMX57_00005 [Planctomycetota bacterium]|nr:hypothetical protein [Planctomycetota bacterium]
MDIDAAKTAARGGDPDGPLVNPSPLMGSKVDARMRHLVGIVEAAACLGDVGAARDALAFHRWRKEMTHGRPPQAGQADAVAPIKLVDDLGAGAAREVARVLAAGLPSHELAELPSRLVEPEEEHDDGLDGLDPDDGGARPLDPSPPTAD